MLSCQMQLGASRRAMELRPTPALPQGQLPAQAGSLPRSRTSRLVAVVMIISLALQAAPGGRPCSAAAAKASSGTAAAAAASVDRVSHLRTLPARRC